MSDAKETAPDAAVEPAPPVEVDNAPPTISDTIDQLREKGMDSFFPKEEGDEDDKTTATPDDDGVPGGDVQADAPGDGDGTGDGDAGKDDPVADAPAGDDPAADAGDAGEGEVETGDDPDPKPITVEIPGRRDGETVNIDVNDPELAERLQQLANNGMRRAEFNTQTEALRVKAAEIRQFNDRLATDPSGLILDKATTETRETIVRDILLSDPELLSKVLDQFNEIDRDPNARVAATAQMERDAAIRARKADKVAADNDAYTKSANEIMGAVEALIPEDAPDDKVEAFLEDAIGFLEFKASKEGLATVNPANIKNLLGTRLQLHGLTGTAPANPDGSVDGADQPATPVVVLRKATTKQSEEAAQQGEKLTNRSAQKKATVTAPAGAGAETTQFSPPKGQNVKERLAWLREKHPTM